jgi:hypothetical protein
MMYAAVRAALGADDAAERQGGEPKFKVRDTPEWRKHAADLGSEMLRGSVAFEVIDWDEGKGKRIPPPLESRSAEASVPRSILGGWRQKSEMVHCDLLPCVILESAMNDVVELILNTYQSMRPLDIERAADSRQKISRYIETLESAGQRDTEQLTIYGLAYLTELHEGQDPQFTGC